MKWLLTMSMILIAMVAEAKDPENRSDNENISGIEFHSGTWKEALEKAEKEGKPIFLDISASWCGPCNMLKENTFSNAEVGKYYNENFINVLIDGEKGEGPQLASKYSITGYPTMIYFNSKGEIIARTSGYRDPATFVEMGKTVLAQ